MQLELFPSPYVPYQCDPTAIARGVFRYEVAEALKVLRNVGALRTEEARFWCICELGRLLAQLCPNNVA